MKEKILLVVVGFALVSRLALAADYDFYANTKYPDPELWPDVDCFIRCLAADCMQMYVRTPRC